MMEMNLKGFEQVSAMLKGLPDKVQNRALKPAIRQAANIVRDEARVRAPMRKSQYPAARTAGFSLKAWRAIEKAGFIDTKYLSKGKHRKDKKKYWEFRKPGTLKRSISVGEAPKRAKTLARQYGRNGVFLAVGVAPRAYYGIFFESSKGFRDRGGNRHPSKPFLLNSLKNNTEAVVDRLRSDIAANLKQIQAGG